MKHEPAPSQARPLRFIMASGRVTASQVVPPSVVLNRTSPEGLPDPMERQSPPDVQLVENSPSTPVGTAAATGDHETPPLLVTSMTGVPPERSSPVAAHCVLEVQETLSNT